MRLLFITFLVFVSLQQAAVAQTDVNRTVSTKIADLLAKTPADDAEQLKINAESVAALGEDGLLEFVTGLNAQGDLTRLHFAINGFSYYAIQPGKESWRTMGTKVYGQALGKLSNDEAKLFIITQLEHIGKDDAIIYLQPYLHHDRLSDRSKYRGFLLKRFFRLHLKTLFSP